MSGNYNLKEEHNADDAKLDLSAVKIDEGQKMDNRDYAEPYAGMDKETLLRFSQTPFWLGLRMAFIVIFWAGWLALLVAVIGLTAIHPKCRPAPKLDWWQTSIIYQVYPRSFQDSNGDGLGDLPGIESKLDYLKNLGIGAIWLSPIYDSPMRDFGYDVKNFTGVWPTFGTMEDFDRLVAEIHKRNMKLIMDFIPNHSSNDSEWFQKSRSASSPNDKFYNYYVWKDCPNDQPPNNWVAVFGGSMWMNDSTRNQCYLHQFLESQPDLNLLNPYVTEELDNVLRFWLDRGVDGFRVDAISHAYEDYNWQNEIPLANTTNPMCMDTKNTLYECWNHTYTANLPGVFDIINRWRYLMDEEYYRKGKGYKFMTTEAYGDIQTTMKYYGRFQSDGANFPFNFRLLNLDRNCGGDCVHRLVDQWISGMPPGKTANWVIGNHDRKRISSKMGENFLNAVNTLLLLLPGVPTTYYGDEIGMTDLNTTALGSKYIPQDPYENGKRDPERSPMQWNTSHTAAGFSSTNNTWLPVNPNYLTINVEVQQAHDGSNLKIYKKLASLRQEKTFQYGDMRYAKKDKNIFAFVREFDGIPSYLVAINFGKQNEKADFKQMEGAPVKGTVVFTTGSDVTVKEDDVIDLTSKTVELQPGQGIVVKWDYVIENLI